MIVSRKFCNQSLSGLDELDAMSSLENVAGKIKKHSKEIYVEWEIDNFFSSIPDIAGSFISSPLFYFANMTWNLRLDPNGCTESKNVGWIGVYLMLQNNPMNEKLSIDFIIGIKCDDEKLSKSMKYFFHEKRSGFGPSALIKRKELHQKRQESAPGDSLTLFRRTSNLSQKRDGISALSEDFMNLFINEKDYDATINVKDRTFHVHKLILGSRSPVLSAMFQHDMEGNDSNIINIDDSEPEIFQDFLLFLYSGKTENLSPNTAARLYNLADKYILKDLKQICLEFMEGNMTLDNICEIVILADRHQEKQLMKIAHKWVKNNLKDIVQTDQWYNLMAENIDLAAKLLKIAVPHKQILSSGFDKVLP